MKLRRTRQGNTPLRRAWSELTREKPSADATTYIQSVESLTRQLGQNYLGTEQLLLGMSAQTIGGAVLRSLDVSLEFIQERVLDVVGTSTGSVDAKHQDLTPRSHTCLRYAQAESRGQRLDSGHVLVGLVLESEGVAAQILDMASVDDVSAVRSATQKIRFNR